MFSLVMGHQEEEPMSLVQGWVQLDWSHLGFNDPPGRLHCILKLAENLEVATTQYKINIFEDVPIAGGDVEGLISMN